MNCHHMQKDPQRCEIKLEKFHFNILRCWEVLRKVSRGAESASLPPSRLGRVKLGLHDAICLTDSFVGEAGKQLGRCVNLKAIKYESTSFKRTVADESHRL